MATKQRQADAGIDAVIVDSVLAIRQSLAKDAGEMASPPDKDEA